MSKLPNTKRVAFVAHDETKTELVERVKANLKLLGNHQLWMASISPVWRKVMTSG